MPVRAVDRLQVVKIDKKYCKLFTCRLGRFDLTDQLGLEHRPIGQTGQCVGKGH